MAPITVLLVSLTQPANPTAFLQALKESQLKPILISRVVQWIINPTIADHLLHHEWDFMIVVPTDTPIPQSLSHLLAHTFIIRIAQDDEILSHVIQNNESLLRPATIDPTFNLEKPLIANSTQNVELTPALLAFARSSLCPSGPVLMLNFIAFHPFPSAKESYAKYIEGFKASAGSKRGGLLKVYGETVEMGVWDQVAMAQYPSLEHFADMAADPDYQELNHKFRLPALRDTCILMTTEVALDWEVKESVRWEKQS